MSCPEHVVSADRRLGPQVVEPRSIGTPPMKDAAIDFTASVISVHPTGDVLRSRSPESFCSLVSVPPHTRRAYLQNRRPSVVNRAGGQVLPTERAAKCCLQSGRPSVAYRASGEVLSTERAVKCCRQSGRRSVVYPAGGGVLPT